MRNPTYVSGIASLALLLSLASCGRQSADSRLSRFPADLTDPKYEIAGIYPDAWIGESASAVLQQPQGDQALVIRGMVPNLGNANFKTTVELRVNDKIVATETLGPGDFEVSETVPSGNGKRRISLAFNPLQQLPEGDGRLVGARLQFLGFEPPRPKASGGGDIVRGTGVELAGGWGSLETFQGETFRWVDNDARIRLKGGQSGPVTLLLMVEPGPGMGGRPLLLAALDQSGRQVAVARSEGRGTVKLLVPVNRDTPEEFRLHVDGGGTPINSDPRILNFRVFQLTATR